MAAEAQGVRRERWVMEGTRQARLAAAGLAGLGGGGGDANKVRAAGRRAPRAACAARYCLSRCMMAG